MHARTHARTLLREYARALAACTPPARMIAPARSLHVPVSSTT